MRSATVPGTLGESNTDVMSDWEEMQPSCKRRKRLPQCYVMLHTVQRWHLPVHTDVLWISSRRMRLLGVAAYNADVHSKQVETTQDYCIFHVLGCGCVMTILCCACIVCQQHQTRCRGSSPWEI